MNDNIAIICSAYNSENTIEDMISSVLSQSFKNFILYIVNDGSTDRTLDIIEKFSHTDTRIVTFNRCNHGLTKSLNYCIKKIESSKYIARIDSDDVWHQKKLERQINFLNSNLDVGILGTDFEEFSDYEDEKSYFSVHDRIPITHSQIIADLPFCNPFLHSSIVIRTSIIEASGLYNEGFTYAQDYELWSRVLKLTKGANIPEVLSYRRYSKDMISISREKTQRYYAMRVKINNLYLVNSYQKFIAQFIKDLCVCILPAFLLRSIRKLTC